MNPMEMAGAVEALGALAKILDSLGVVGFIALWLSMPVLLTCAMLLVEYRRNKKQQDVITEMRSENMEMLNAFRAEAQVWRAESQKTLETYRSDTNKALREMGQAQRDTDKYYRDNVELVKNYERMARGNQDMLVSVASALSRLSTIMETWKKI